MSFSNTKILILEFFLLFVIFPISLSFNFPIWIKIILGILGFAYTLVRLKKTNYSFFKTSMKSGLKNYALKVIFIFLIIVTTTYLFLLYDAPEKLFYVVRNKFSLWIYILFVYSFLSVLPQEIIYRSFFFKRYANLIKNKHLLVFINAIAFSLGHLFFQNTLVLFITFLGGLLFGYSYLKSKSLVLVSIEHALYGCWLFTVGMGDMLGFPGM